MFRDGKFIPSWHNAIWRHATLSANELIVPRKNFEYGGLSAPARVLLCGPCYMLRRLGFNTDDLNRMQGDSRHVFGEPFRFRFIPTPSGILERFSRLYVRVNGGSLLETHEPLWRKMPREGLFAVEIEFPK